MNAFEDISYRNDPFLQQARIVDSYLKIQDFYHMLYLRPLQCVLNQNKAGLAKGLKIVTRKSQNQYDFKQIKHVFSFEEFQGLSQPQKLKLAQKSGHRYNNYFDYVQQNQGDNLLSQMKTHGAIEIAICICMQDENKAMLNNTLFGVGENIINFCKQGVDPDKIVVIIVQDGIEKMDSSVFQLFNVFQVESGMKFNSGKKKNIHELIQKLENLEKNRRQYGWEGQHTFVDVNSLLFTKEEQETRNKLRLVNVKRQYDAVRRLLNQVLDLFNKKSVIYEDLPPKALYFFQQQCTILLTQRRKEAAQYHSQQELGEYLQLIYQNLKDSKPLIYNALTKTKHFCEQYIDSRSEMSHVSFFRTSQYFPDDSGFSRNDILELSQQQRRKSHINVTQTEQDELFDQESFQLDKMRQKSTIKMNLLFVVQYRKNQKLSSHNWFFNGFCKEFSNCQFQGDVQVSSHTSEAKPKKVKMSEVSPKYTILLDVGLRPEGTALCKMYNTMINHPKIGGVCGYMSLKTKKNDNESQNDLSQKIDFVSNFFMNFVDIQRAQQLQGHFGHLVDKSFESIFKFVQVLPEAFSGYNMNAIWGSTNQLKQRNSDKLLNSYFKSIDDKLKDKKYKKNNLSLKMIFARILLPDAIIKTFSNDVSNASYEDLMYESNVQDRILSMVVHQNNFDLIFLPDAYSLIDSVKDIPSLMAQRKRWINGRYFAFEKFSEQFAEMGCCRILSIQIWYLALMNMLAFIAPGLYMFSINLVMDVVKADVLAMLFSDNLVEDHTLYGIFIYTMNFLNSLLILGLIYFSINLNSENQKFVKYVYKVSTVLGTVSLAILVIQVVDLVRGLSQSSSYLISNQSTPSVESLPGGQGTIDFMRYLLLAIMGMYVIPLLIYSLLFSNIRTIFQVLLGLVSFVFYYPTYLIVLNIYALCRMDHLSWGMETSGGGKKKQIQSNWKIVKMIHAGKMIFWNVIVAGILVHWGSNYLVRFYLIFSLMIIIAFSMAFKAVLAIFYYMHYKININSNPPLKTKKNVIPRIQPSLYKYFKSNSGNPSTLETHLRNRVKDNVCHLLIGSKSSYDRRKSFQILQILNQSAEKMNKMRCFAENPNESSHFEVWQRAQKRSQIPNLSDRELKANISKKNKVELTPIKINHRVDISCEKLLIQQMDESFNEPSSQNYLMPNQSENALQKEKILSKITLESVQPDQQEQNQHQDKKQIDRKLNYENETHGRNKSVKKIKQNQVSSNSYKRSNTDRKRLIKAKILRVQSPFKDMQSEQFGQLKQSSDNGRSNRKKRNKSQNLLTKPQSKQGNLSLNHAVDLMRKKLRTLQIDDFTN